MRIRSFRPGGGRRAAVRTGVLVATLALLVPASTAAAKHDRGRPADLGPNVVVFDPSPRRRTS